MDAPLSYLINRDLCFVEIFTVYPGIFSTVGMAVLIVFKFVILKNINNQKERIYITKGENMKMNWIFKCLKILNINIVNLFIIVTLFLFQSLMQIIIIAPFQFKCSNLQFQISYALFIASITILVIFGVLMFFYEIILNIKRILKCDLISFWKEDIYYLRFETYILGIPSGIVFILSSLINVTTGETVASSILSVISNVLLYLFLGEFALFLTIFNFIKSLICPMKDVGELTLFLKTEDGNKLMLDACKIGKFHFISKFRILY